MIPPERYGCRWCSDTYDEPNLLIGHAMWSHRDEIQNAVTRPAHNPRGARIVTCTSCRGRDGRIEEGLRRGLRPGELFAVTAYAGDREGHRFYHSSLGQITLCTARTLTLPSWALKQAQLAERAAG